MPHKEPQNYSNFDWIILSIVSAWAAISSFMQRKLSGVKLKRKIYYAFQDLTLSSGTAYLTAMGLMSYGIKEGVAVAIAGYAGHKATHFMFLIEIFLEKKIGLNIDDKEKK